MTKGIHPADHHMLKIETPDQAQPMSDWVGAIVYQRGRILIFVIQAYVPLTLGLRIYTKLHAPTKIRGQLRHGQGNIKWSKA
jgi:hypothetical protein